METSIYYEALWVVVLFAATATLREAFGELCVHSIAKSLLSCSHISGRTIDTFQSCSNGGRSLGFGAAWRMWNVDRSDAISKLAILAPFCCWLIGMPIKLVAVQAVRGGNPVLGYWGTWTLLATMLVDRFHGLTDLDGRIISYRKLFQARFCRLESYGMMINSQDYDQTKSLLHPIPKEAELGVDVSWSWKGNRIESVNMKLARSSSGTDTTPNGLNFRNKDESELGLLAATNE